MYFLQAVQPPVVIVYDGRLRLTIPRLTVKQIGVWMNEEHQKRIEEAVKGKNEQQAAEWLNMYRPLPPTIDELRAMVITPVGTEYVLKIAIKRAKAVELDADGKEGKKVHVTEALIDDMLEGNGAGSLMPIAIEISDLVARDLTKPPSKSGKSEDGEKVETASKEVADPLPSGGSGDLAA